MNLKTSDFYTEDKTFKDKFLDLKFSLIFLVFSIGVISCFAMYSTDGGNFAYHTVSHIYRFTIFFILFIFLSFIDINFWHKYAYVFYVAFVLLLIAVEFFGLYASGSKRWLNLYLINLQPSELAKVGIVLFLSKYYHRISYSNVSRIKFLILPILVLLIPVFFVIRQPDLGTALLIIAGGVIMLWLAGLSMKYFAYIFTTLLLVMPYGIYLLEPYQKLRILTFLNPERDPLGAGYQIIQSKIAIGSGGIFGKGYLNGSQSYLDYLPEKHTDFIFTLFSEEFGFIGSLILLLLFMLLIFSIIKVGKDAKNSFSKFFCFGFASILFIYITVNMSMVLGLLPTVGSPLPIMSYGGSSMLSVMFGLGIVMSCHTYRKKNIN